jgi:predicted amidohydrolase
VAAAPGRPITVAAGQATCVPLDVAANAATAADLVRRAADRGADLLVLPELFLTGYELPAIAADPPAYAVGPGDLRLDPLAEACAQTRTAVVAGAPDHDGGGALHISALVLGRDGRFVDRYDKQHPTAKERAAGVTPGRTGRTLTLDGWRLGLAIFADAGHPEHARAAAAAGCHAYLVGSLLDAASGARHHAAVFPERAKAIAGYVVLANHRGRSGPYDSRGHSAVGAPDGTLLADAGTADPSVAVATLDPTAVPSPHG